MKRLLLILAFVAAPSASAWAQIVVKPPVYTCYVLADGSDGSGYVVLGIARNGNFTAKNRFLLPDQSAVKNQCNAEIAKMQGQDSAPVTLGLVDLSTPTPTPPPVPEPALVDFQNRVSLARKLMGIVPSDNKTLVTLLQGIGADAAAHPEWLDSI